MSGTQSNRPSPAAPLPSAAIPDRLRACLIPVTVFEFSRRKTGPLQVKTDRAFVAFSVVIEAGENGDEISGLSMGGLDADAESLAALNCYLRTKRALGRFLMPFQRLEPGRHRFAWSAFIAHLGLNFR